jgi:hypothetical protein
MAANASRVNQLLDTLAAVTLRATGLTAAVATGTNTPISLNELRTAYWSNFEIPHGKMVVGISVSSPVGTNETYVINLLVDDVVAMNNSPVTIDTFTVPRGTVGFFSRIIDCKDIPGLDPDHDGLGKWLQLTHTLGGTSPSLTYSAWLCRSLGE